MALKPPPSWHTREESGLKLDRALNWWHDGERIEHPNIIEVFNRGLRVRDDGRITLEFGGDWCFVAIEGCAFGVVATDEAPDGQLAARLSDRTAELLELSTLALDEDGALTIAVKNRRARARFTRAAHFQLASRFAIEADRVWVVVGERRHATPLAPSDLEVDGTH